MTQDLNRDSFWDGSNNSVHKTQLDPAQYHDTAAETMPLSGRSMDSLLPPGVWGARGTIIRSAGDQGAPLGHDPDAVATRINVDPDIPGQSFTYDPTKITQEALFDAMAAGNMNATSIEDRRFKAANVLKQFAVTDVESNNVTKSLEPRSPPREAPVNLPGTYVVPASTDGGGQVPMQDSKQEAPAPIGVELGRPATPIQRAGGAAPAQPVLATPQKEKVEAQPVKAADVAVQDPGPPLPAPGPPPSAPGPPITSSLFQPHMNAPKGPAQPWLAASTPEVDAGDAPPNAPAIKTAFEVRGMPFKTEAYFHQVIREGHALILVFDKRAVGYPMMFPQMPEDVNGAPDIAVHVSGSSSIYVTAMTGIQFPLDQYEICVLLIKDEQPLPQ